ncbi:MAG TPA: Na+/H+ antiporter subunit E, partial [Halanaerobiales bacterium]|nr:Na+/H+ antiporter subunit E [Halanaerobiales bacterium]
LFSNLLFRKKGQPFSLFNYLRKFYFLLLFIPVFFYEAMIAALKVSKHVFERKPSFSPGIVRVKTHLTSITALTILANLITLTPGTLTLDFDKSERVYYIHWIDVTTREEAEARKEIIERFEKWLGVIFK